MASSRYTAEALLLLRQSPLCTKPPNLPPAEQWMGPPPDNTRTQARAGTDRAKGGDAAFALDPANRRSMGDRNTQRNASNPEDIVLGPPKMSFASASSLRNQGSKAGSDSDRPLRESDSRDRFGLRSRSDQADGGTLNSGSGSYGGNNDRSRDIRNPNYRRRGDADQDSDGWSTVKPRKSFGHEGAERFHGRMGGGGGGGDRYGRDDRRPRDRDDGDVGGRDRPRRTFDRDRDGGDDNEGSRRNGGRVPWYKDNNSDGNEDRPERAERSERSERNAQRERIDRTKNWRERDPDSQASDNYRDRNHANNNDRGNNYERRWDRDRDYFHHQRVEREPEWLDEDPTLGGEEEKTGGHTEEDLRRFMEAMKGRGASTSKPADDPSKTDTYLEDDAGKTAKAESAPATELGPDRFFEQFSKVPKTDDTGAGGIGDAMRDTAKARTGKSSRFTSFFSSQEDSKRQAEPPAPAAVGVSQSQSPPNGHLPGAQPPPDAAEKEAFKALLQKLKLQTLQGSGGGAGSAATGPVGKSAVSVPANNEGGNGIFQELSAGTSPSAGADARQRSTLASPNLPFPQPQANMQQQQQQRDEARFRSGMAAPAGVSMPPQQMMHEILLQRPPMPTSQPSPSAGRPEQMIQELLAQRQQTASQEGGTSRLGTGLGPGAGPGPGPNAPTPNAQSEFLVQLMRNGSDGRRAEELLMRMPQPQKQVNIPSIPDREASMAVDYARERDRISILQRQAMRPHQGPPGFADEQYHRQDTENRPPQPTQILQRPPPPGLEHTLQHGPPPAFLQAAAGGRMQQQSLPNQGPQQPMIPPPPGLGVNHPSNQPTRVMSNMISMPNMPGMPNMGNMTTMAMPNIAPNMPPSMFPPNFVHQGPFSTDGIPGGPPRNMGLPPPGFFPGNGPPGFMPHGMGFQGAPLEGMIFPFDSRGMPPPPPPGVFRRS